jgi:hypothetical protein
VKRWQKGRQSGAKFRGVRQSFESPKAEIRGDVRALKRARGFWRAPRALAGKWK